MKTIRVLRACAILAALVCVPIAYGQAFIQQGNALDANTRVGSGGLNYGARQYAPGAGNRIVTGNVAGGGSFRGFSPVRDPSALFFNNYSSPYYGGSGALGLSGLYGSTANYGLPSDRLAGFNRESVSVNTIRQGATLGNLNRTPYYPGGTVANTGAIIAGLNRPGSSQLISPYAPARPDMRITPPNPLDTARTGGGTLLSVAPRLVRIDSGQQLTGPVNERLLDSRLFGAVREIPLSDIAAQAQRNSGGALSTPPPELSRPQPARLPGVGEQQPAPGESETEGDAESAASNLRVPSETGSLASAGPNATLRGTGGALARSLSPSRDQDRLAQAGDRTGAGPRPGAGAARPELDSTQPLRSFIGTQATAADRRMEEAEDLLKQGQYYRAADAFAAAQTIDPGNPLPLLGRSASLLLAGDYMSSANLLFTAIRLFESQVALQVDMKAFVSDIVLLESRRSDLEERLQLFDDFRLRFLLGYLQFSTGQPEDGLINMEQASQKVPPELGAIRRFVVKLKEKSSPGTATRPAQ